MAERLHNSFVAPLSVLVTLATLGAATPVSANGWSGLFDVDSRTTLLSTEPYREIRQLCLSVAIDPAWAELVPIKRLSATEGYGSDQSAEDFSWAVMVLSGRVLAGDAKAAHTSYRMAS